LESEVVNGMETHNWNKAALFEIQSDENPIYAMPHFASMTKE
jgi:hypothetical protein